MNSIHYNVFLNGNPLYFKQMPVWYILLQSGSSNVMEGLL